MASKYQMWMTYNGGAEKLRFPVLPERIHIQKGKSNHSISIQGLGEVVIMQDPAAMVINFAGILPAKPFPGVQVEALTPPLEIAERIATWKRGDRSVQFMVTGTLINAHFTIEDFSYYEQGGDVGTLHYSLTLKEYKTVAEARQVQVDVPRQIAILPEPTPHRDDNRAQPPTHTVVRGDTLWAIARQQLGSGARYREIFELNRSIIGNPCLIFPGQVLQLP